MPEKLPYDLDKAVAAKEINDYMNHYLTVLDTKAGAFLAGNVAAASVLLNDLPQGGAGLVAVIVSIALFAASTIAAGCVIFPRLPPCGNSVIFWGDVAADADAGSYVQRFDSCINEGKLDEHYAMQNFFCARVLRRKFRWLRTGIFLFFLALATGFSSYLRLLPQMLEKMPTTEASVKLVK